MAVIIRAVLPCMWGGLLMARASSSEPPPPLSSYTHHRECVGLTCDGAAASAAAAAADGESMLAQLNAAAPVASLSLLQMAAAKTVPSATTAAAGKLDTVAAVDNAQQRLASELEKRGLNKDYAELNLEQTMEKLELERRAAVASSAATSSGEASSEKEPLGLLARSASFVSSSMLTRNDVELNDALECCGYALLFSFTCVLVYSIVRYARIGDPICETLFSSGRMQFLVWLGGVVLLILTSIAPLMVPWLAVLVGTCAQLYIYERQANLEQISAKANEMR